MTSPFLTSAEVGKQLGVGPTSIKRWADSGLLPCIRTAGGHRRFRLEEIERFRLQRSGTWAPDSERVVRWIELLTSDTDAFGVQSSLLGERSQLGSWWRVAELMGVVLDELGRRWQAGEITVVEEHGASERLTRGLARITEAMVLAPDAPRCMLAAPEGEDHVLPLNLAEPILREAGWSTLWVGRGVPVEDLARAVLQRRISLLALTASQAAADRVGLAQLARTLEPLALQHGFTVVFGGSAPWPEPEGGSPLVRVRDFVGFQGLLTRLAERELSR